MASAACGTRKHYQWSSSVRRQVHPDKLPALCAETVRGMMLLVSLSKELSELPWAAVHPIPCLRAFADKDSIVHEDDCLPAARVPV